MQWYLPRCVENMLAAKCFSATLDTLILACKKFHTFEFFAGKLANFTLATVVSLNYNICKDRVKLAAFKIS